MSLLFSFINEWGGIMTRILRNRRVCLLVIIIALLAQYSIAIGSPSSFNMMHKGQNVHIEFGMDREKIESIFGSPIERSIEEKYKPEGIRQVWDYSNFVLFFDDNRLFQVIFQSSYQGNPINIIGLKRRELDEALGIGDSFEKVEKVLKDFEVKLRTKYDMKPYGGYGEKPDNDKMLYHLHLKPPPAFGSIASVSLWKTQYDWKFSYKLNIGKDKKVERIEVTNNDYSTDFVLGGGLGFE